MWTDRGTIVLSRDDSFPRWESWASPPCPPFGWNSKNLYMMSISVLNNGGELLSKERPPENGEYGDWQLTQYLWKHVLPHLEESPSLTPRTRRHGTTCINQHQIASDNNENKWHPSPKTQTNKQNHKHHTIPTSLEAKYPIPYQIRPVVEKIKQLD